jgi:hypothetical protein
MRGKCRYGGRAAPEMRTRAVRLRMAIESRTTASRLAYAIAGGGRSETDHPLLTDRPIALSAEVMPASRRWSIEETRRLLRLERSRRESLAHSRTQCAQKLQFGENNEDDTQGEEATGQET